MRLDRTTLGLALIAAGSVSRLPAQELPVLHPLNPVAESRTGLYFQPFIQPSARWHFALSGEYGSMAELNFRLFATDTTWLLDAEAYRVSAEASRALSPRLFLLVEGGVGGVYAGGIDGFVNGFHNFFGIPFPEREARGNNNFAYRYVFPGGHTVRRKAAPFYLTDLRVGLGTHISPRLQSVFAVTLPTNTAGAGYGRGTVSASLLNTFRVPVTSRLFYEGSLNLGVTPHQGDFSRVQRTVFFAGTSGFNWRFGRQVFTFANLFLHSSYYHDTGVSGLDDADLTFDFGWALRTGGGTQWRIGMTEDLMPSGPAVDLNFRVGVVW